MFRRDGGSPSPHFSPVVCCNGGYARGYCVALGRPPQRIVIYVSGGLGREPCLATTTHEKRGLVGLLPIQEPGDDLEIRARQTADVVFADVCGSLVVFRL